MKFFEAKYKVTAHKGRYVVMYKYPFFPFWGYLEDTYYGPISYTTIEEATTKMKKKVREMLEAKIASKIAKEVAKGAKPLTVSDYVKTYPEDFLWMI